MRAISTAQVVMKDAAEKNEETQLRCFQTAYENVQEDDQHNFKARYDHRNHGMVAACEGQQEDTHTECQRKKLFDYEAFRSFEYTKKEPERRERNRTCKVWFKTEPDEPADSH